jgi:Spy/CpxP family protein refolding chaperone
MDSRTKQKWQIRLAVIGILIIGFIAGALAMNAYRQWRNPPGSGFISGKFNRMLERLDLTAEQEVEVKKIMDQARTQILQTRKESEPKFREVRRQTDERLKAVLTAEQWEEFQRMKPEFRGRRPHGKDRRGDSED